MLITPLPFEYLPHLDPRLDPADRMRRMRRRASDARVRRTAPKGEV